MSDREIFAKPVNCDSTRDVTKPKSNQSLREPSYFDRRSWRAQQVSPRTRDDTVGLVQVENSPTLSNNSCMVQRYAQGHGNTVDSSSYAAFAMSSARDARSSETSQLEGSEAHDENLCPNNSPSTTLSPTAARLSYSTDGIDGWSDETSNQVRISEDYIQAATRLLLTYTNTIVNRVKARAISA
ncbi:hypothetical protein O1611_g10629 [Lasiodiplodia mahajangana]|uniref:Uncharacterized protein n=1 Tax=Lasiodiplodia mahajangana TaxID=1108764 RepID=A0ACC2IWB5_9PEZI|nr:hypothetical protein O1611_g10629 [Lasiodiplodia mahajangana]